MKKHGFCSFIIALLLLSGCGFSRPETVKEEKEVVSETYEDVLVKARQIDADGNLYLAVTPQYLNEKGYEAGQYVSKFGKLSRGHRTGKCQFSFQSQRKAVPIKLKVSHNCTHLTRW